MKSVTKAEWIEALRSGNYAQGQAALYNPAENTFCCLGVLCTLANDGQPTCGGSWPSAEYGGLRDEILKLYARLGLKALGAPSASYMSLVIDMNDSGKSFAEIADFLEQNLQPQGD